VETDRRTNITKLIVAFRNFAKAPKNKKGGRGMVRRNDNGKIDEKKAWQISELFLSVVLNIALLRAWTQTILQDFPQLTPGFAFC